MVLEVGFAPYFIFLFYIPLCMILIMLMKFRALISMWRARCRAKLLERMMYSMRRAIADVANSVGMGDNDTASATHIAKFQFYCYC